MKENNHNQHPKYGLRFQMVLDMKRLRAQLNSSSVETKEKIGNVLREPYDINL